MMIHEYRQKKQLVAINEKTLKRKSRECMRLVNGLMMMMMMKSGLHADGILILQGL